MQTHNISKCKLQKKKNNHEQTQKKITIISLTGIILSIEVCFKKQNKNHYNKL